MSIRYTKPNPAGIHLDLDCESNMKEKVSQWIKENLAVITKENMNIRHLSVSEHKPRQVKVLPIA